MSQTKTYVSPQAKQVLEHLTKHGGITSNEAVTLYQILNLPELIRQLRRDGVEIDSNRHTSRSISGKAKPYTRYTIKL